MKIGTLDIKKAYLGALELTHSNAFIGTYPVIPASASYAGLKMTSTGNSTISFNYGATVYRAPDLKYSLDGGATWTQWDFSAISLTDGQTVCFKGNNSYISYSENQFNNFVMSGSIAASGNIMSILDDGACTRTSVTYACFLSLFNGCSSLTTAPELPATTLNQYCYYAMFAGCSSLTTSPELPATTLNQYCYAYMFDACSSLNSVSEIRATTLDNFCCGYMFRGCSSLTTAPALPATSLSTANYCYQHMFRGCSSLTTAPALPATTLSTGCYQYMFYGCSSLTTAPELPATTLATSCYASMFAMCSSLNYVKCMGNPRTSSGNPLSGWLNGVSQTGTFIQDVDVIFTPGPNGVPVGWTTQDSNGILGFKYVEQKVVDSLESNLQLPSSGDSYIFVVYDGSEQLHRVITTTLTTAAGLSVTYPVGSYETMSYTTNSQGMKEIEESEVLRVSKVRIGSGEYTAKPFIAQCAWSGAAVTFRDSLSSSASYLRMSGTNQLTFGSTSYQWEFLTSHNSKYYYDIRWTSSSYGNNRYLKQSQIISSTAGDCSLNVGAQPSSSSNGSYTPRYYKRVSYYVS